jgi:hypothetical protein
LDRGNIHQPPDSAATGIIGSLETKPAWIENLCIIVDVAYSEKVADAKKLIE